MDFVRHYHHGEEDNVTPSLSELYDKNPRKAREVSKEITKLHPSRGKYYIRRRNKVEEWLYNQAKRLGIKPKTKYPLYATLGDGPQPSWGAKEKSTDYKMPKSVTFTLGDSFPVHASKGEVYTYSKLQKLLKKYPDIKDIPIKGKHGYIEAQIWDREQLMKKAFWTGFAKEALDKNIIARLLKAGDDPNLHVMIQSLGGTFTNEDPEEFKRKLLDTEGSDVFTWSVTGKETDFSPVSEVVGG